MKTKRQPFLSLLAIPLLCLAMHASATPMTPITNIVANGGFESGSFAPGWTQSGNTSNTGVDSDNTHTGNFAAGFGNVGSISILDQTLTTIVGATYDLSFFLANEFGDKFPNGGSSGTQIFQVFWNGVMVFNLGPSGPFGYTQFGATGLTVTGTSTVLEFRVQNDPSFYDLDDITVTGNISAVPETLSTMWLGLTFVGMIGFARLRRKVVPALAPVS
jgi:hypothetical protein